MDKIFVHLAKMSTAIVFMVLIGTVISLYINARPAIKEFGSYFLIDPRWGVEIELESVTDNIEQLGQQPEMKDLSEDAISEIDVEEDNFSYGLDDFEDDFVPMEDETDTGQSELEGTSKTTKEVYGGAVPIVGTIFSTIIALLFAVPISMGIAVFLSEIAKPIIAAPVGVAIELLAAIPSIIYGMWGLFYFGPFLASIFGGNSVSLLVGGLVLGVMIIPFMAALSRDAINTTPDILKEAAYALGATKTEVIKDVIFPYAKKGIIGSIIVSLGRALGETMAVAFVIGGVYQFVHKVTDPTNSIPVALANNFSESSGMSLSVLFYLALILFVVSFIIIFSAKYFFLRRGSY